jgi:hypothetical protein
MAVVGGMGLNGRALYSNVVKPIEVNVQFTVAPTNGAGVSSVKSNGYVQSVYMHSSSPSAANPNPANGFAMIQLKAKFQCILECSLGSARSKLWC